MHLRVATKWEEIRLLTIKDQETLMKLPMLRKTTQTSIGQELKPLQVYKKARFPPTLPTHHMDPQTIKPTLRGEPETSKLSTIGHDGSNLAKDLSDKSIEPKEITNDVGLSNLGNKECKDGIEKDNEWIECEEPLDLVDQHDESIYESLIEKMPRSSLNYDFRIKKGDPNNLKFPCMIGHKFIPNAYIDIDLPMNIMSLAYYNDIRINGFEYDDIK
ncbi:hypothetical protein Tco_0550287 [Tanacetum coccineum]